MTSIRSVSSFRVAWAREKREGRRGRRASARAALVTRDIPKFQRRALIEPLSPYYRQQRIRSLLSSASLFSLLHVKDRLGLADGRHHGNCFYELSGTHVCANGGLRFFTNSSGVPGGDTDAARR